MKICIAGLGIIGGSLCMALKRAGHIVAGWNRSKTALDYALKNGIIDECANDFLYDVVIVALPPEATVKFIDSNVFKTGAIISDICGVKKYIEDAVYSKPRNFRYVGLHPMAGKEVSGIENACVDLFDRANMVITHCNKTDGNALETMRRLAADMGFRYIVECDSLTHDKKIAYTSQLAHIVSNAYVKNDEMDGCIRFTGGSFQDMTRIAGMDEGVWSSLYLYNSENLCDNIDKLIVSLSELKSAIAGGNKDNLEQILRDGRLRWENGKNSVEKSDIFVKKLK